jgi:hypothetical protein
MDGDGGSTPSEVGDTGGGFPGAPPPTTTMTTAADEQNQPPDPIRQQTRGRRTRVQSIRTKASTGTKGVTRVVSRNRGNVKYDVQFVFCDEGVKQHPKIYGFGSLEQAARAFDVLALKRYFERSKANVQVAIQNILMAEGVDTNYNVEDYVDMGSRDGEFLELVGLSSRDQLVYALKDVSKKKLAFTKESMCGDLKGCLMDGDGRDDARLIEELEEDALVMDRKRKSYEKMAMEKHGNGARAKAGSSKVREDDVVEVKGLRFVLDLCALCGQQVQPEMHLAADLLYWWNIVRSDSEGMFDAILARNNKLHYPGQLYKSFLFQEGLCDMETLSEALDFVSRLWFQGDLAKLWNSVASYDAMSMTRANGLRDTARYVDGSDGIQSQDEPMHAYVRHAGDDDLKIVFNPDHETDDTNLF